MSDSEAEWMDGWTWLRPNNRRGKAGKEAEEAEAEEAFRNTFSLQRDITSAAAAARERCMPKNGKRREREHSERRRSLKCFEVFVQQHLMRRKGRRRRRETNESECCEG